MARVLRSSRRAWWNSKLEKYPHVVVTRRLDPRTVEVAIRGTPFVSCVFEKDERHWAFETSVGLTRFENIFGEAVIRRTS